MAFSFRIMGDQISYSFDIANKHREKTDPIDWSIKVSYDGKEWKEVERFTLPHQVDRNAVIDHFNDLVGENPDFLPEDYEEW